MGGRFVVLNSNHSKGFAVRFVTGPDDVAAALPRGSQPFIKVTAAFHLPEVCRQIYAETVLTAYRQNTFVFGVRHTFPNDTFKRLMIAQRRAITKIQIECDYLFWHMVDANVHLKYHKRVTDRLPNISTIVVTEAVLRGIKLIFSDRPGTGNFRNEGMWHAWISQKFEKIYGNGIKVAFEGP